MLTLVETMLHLMVTHLNALQRAWPAAVLGRPRRIADLRYCTRCCHIVAQPMQLFTLVVGLSLATALVRVQAQNAEDGEL
jgi:hypothetical protein